MMSSTTIHPRASDEACVLAYAMAEALVSSAPDDAERLYGELCAAEPRARSMLIYPMMIAAQRNRLLDFYRDLRENDPDNHLEIQALCLHRLGDPGWERVARQVEATHADPVVQRAMRELMGQPEPLQ
ncbi:MAG: hypothetical protein J0H69_07405 [Burkholderiales bacterium]|nr:hypothetical protein [Burkholderiales bacterium]